MRTAKDLLRHNLVRLREAAGWKQPELADKTTMSFQMIQKIEQGKTNPSLDTLDKLAKGLKANHAELFFDDSVPIDKPMTVSEMSISDLKSVVSEAVIPKHDIELQRLRNKVESIPEEFFDLWKGLRPGRQAVCLFVLTKDRRFVPFLSDETLKLIESVLQSLDRPTPQPRK